MAAVSIDLRLLGRPSAERDAQPVDLPAKALALLGYLAAASGPQPRERILGLLRGESAEEAARKNLRNTLWTIRKALGEDAVLEHHSSFDWDQKAPPTGNDEEAEGAQGLAKLRRDAENWDAPIIVTTAVQFFESLFAARTSQSRKLHNLAKSWLLRIISILH